MPGQVQITLNLDVSGATAASEDSAQMMSKAFTEAATKTDLAWSAVVNSFKSNLAAYNVAVEQGGAKAKLFNQILDEGVASGKTYAQSLAIAATAVREMGDAAVAGGAKLNAGMTQNFYKASLLSQELGLGIPRAMERVIARTPMLASALDAAFPILLAVGFAGMMGTIYDKIISTTDAWGGYTDAVKKTYQETLKASESAFVNPKTLDSARQHLSQVNGEIQHMADLQKKMADQAPSLPAEAGIGVDSATLGDYEQLNNAVDKGNNLEKQRLELLQSQAKLQKQLNDLTYAADAKSREAGLQGYALAAQKYKDQLASINALAVENHEDPLVTNQKKRDALASFQNERIQLERQASAQIMQMRHQVVEASLTGEDQIKQKTIDDLETLQRKRNETLISEKAYQQERLLIYQKEAQAEAKLNDQAEKETESMERAARDASLSGDDLVVAHKRDALHHIVALYANHEIDVGQYLRRIVAITQQTDAQILKNDQNGIDKREALLASAADRERDAESAAALASVPPWQRAYAQIVIESDNRIRRINEEEAKQLLQVKKNSDAATAIENAAQAERAQVVAEANERIAEENRKNVEQLGNDLNSVFDDIGSGNIGKRILDNMKKLFAEILAAWILTSTTMKSIFGGLFGTLVFGPGSMESQMGGAAAGGGFMNFLGSALGFGSGSGTASPASASAAAAAAGVTSSAAAASGAAGADPLTQFLGQSLGLGGNPLTTQSLSAAGIASGSTATSGSKGLSGLFGGFFAGGSKALGGLLGLAGIAAGIFGTKLGGVGAAGSLILALALTGKLGALGLASLGTLGTALVGGAAGGLLGFGLGENFGSGIGALGGFGTGFLTGAVVGGPLGALIGGLIGAIGGIFGGLFGGHKRKKAANQYFDQQLQPAVKQIVAQYEGFQLDYGTAISDLEQLRSQAQDQLGKLKGQGKDVFRKKVGPAIDAAEAQINSDEKERTRRAGLAFGPPQFHEGGYVSAASAWMTKPGELMALLKQGEFVMNPQATQRNRTTLERMNAGGTPTLGSNVTLNIHAMDADSFMTFLRKGGSAKIRQALFLDGNEGKF